MSKKIIANSNFYFRVIDFLKQDLNLTKIADKFHISKQLLNYYLRPLKHHNIIKKVGKVWLINDKKVPIIDNIKNLELVKKIQMSSFNGNTLFTNKSNQVRSHGCQFIMKIPIIKNWNKRFSFLEKKHLSPYKLKGGCAFVFRNHKIHLFDKCIRIYYTKGLSYYAERPLNAFLYAFYDCKGLVKGLERLFSNTSLTINGEYWIKPIIIHYSLIHNELAKYLEEQGKKLVIKNEKGEIWLIVDNSFNFHEAEFPHPKTGLQDATNFQPIFNLLEKRPKLLQEMIKDHNELMVRVKELSDNQMNLTLLMEQFDKNMLKIVKRMEEK